MNIPSSQAMRRGLLLSLLASISYGIFPTASRAVYADGGSAVLVLLTNTWARALSMSLFSLMMGKRLFSSPGDIRESLIGGIFQAVSVIGIIWALMFVPGPIVIIIVFSHTLMLLFFMAWRGEIKLDFATVIATIVALAGLSLVVDPFHALPKSALIGMALAFMAALATVSRMYVYGHLTRARYPTVVGAENFLIAATIISFSPFFAPVQLPAHLMGYVWLAVSVLSSVTGAFCMFFGISLLGSFRYSLFAKLEPVFTSLFAYGILGEILKTRQYLGIGVVLGSLALYQFYERKRIKIS